MEAIRLDQVCLWRRTQEEFSYDLKRTVLSFLEGKYKQPSKKQVIENLNLTITTGDKLGIIGSNGSGKSTLLKLICGVLEPTTGTVRVWGRVAPLIELGAGFDSELSVIDNIILYGVLLGYSKPYMQSRVQDILDFAELGDYGLAPQKSLSSGMTARLGFAIATDVHPDILILDEVLSVGDERFKNKCKQRLEAFWQANATVLVVSHDLEFIRDSCHQAIWLDRGRIRYSGSAAATVQAYLAAVHGGADMGLSTPGQ
ncbi:ABC transporter ATP-binding protein [Nodosilinea nodulosa]|uniref:ABC transporter ATP-binding protein n=1 Tax=Nodosilinea nodulosa TaxID=416001 RepID=UPI000318D94D|nr:ABC transporter ATP-binding protein [Nodosilinea nodulosa]